MLRRKRHCRQHLFKAAFICSYHC